MFKVTGMALKITGARQYWTPRIDIDGHQLSSWDGVDTVCWAKIEIESHVEMMVA
jgi:hypothetical protein